MALSVQSYKGVIGFGVDTVSGERGFVQKMLNKTGGATVKGTVICCSDATDKSFMSQADEFCAIGVVAEAGVADASEAWIWVNGSVCQVLWKDGETATHGYVALCADTDGRALNIAVPSANPVVADHFKEIGHVMESKSSGTDVLVLCHLHFN
jgi:hypothetical protein